MDEIGNEKEEDRSKKRAVVHKRPPPLTDQPITNDEVGNEKEEARSKKRVFVHKRTPHLTDQPFKNDVRFVAFRHQIQEPKKGGQNE